MQKNGDSGRSKSILQNVIIVLKSDLQMSAALNLSNSDSCTSLSVSAQILLLIRYNPDNSNNTALFRKNPSINLSGSSSVQFVLPPFRPTQAKPASI